MRIEQVKPQYASCVKMFAAVQENQISRTLLMHGESGRILLRGMHIENAATKNGIAAEYAAAFVGATVEDGNGSVTLKCGDGAETFAVVEENDMKYIPADVFAERYGMTLSDVNGVTIISPYDEFTWRGTDAICNAVDFFADMD